MSKSDLKYLIEQDLLRHNIRKKLNFFLFLRFFIIEKTPGINFMIIFRFCQHYRTRNRLLFYFFYIWLRRLKYKYGIDISYRTKIGKGLYIGHFGGIVIHGDTVIGDFCNLSQGITIGILARGKKPGIAKIGNRVFIGPGAAILGGITIGDDVLIGTNSVVTFDVPDHSVVAAPVSSIISSKGSEGYIGNIQ